MARADETLAGRYELLDVLGRGGMGVVYRARDLTLDRIVAVKVLPAALAEVGALVDRFEREARAAARLNHPNIVAVFDTGHDRGARYIVMECVPGESLDRRLRGRGRLGVSEAIEIAAQTASALAAAHAAGIIHRDIKPGNIVVQPSGVVKVLDFGIARVSTDVALTGTTTLLGSAPYMSPEMAAGQAADARSDIYALGCVLYEMLAGRPPFVGDNPVAVMNQHVSARPQRLHELNPETPTGVDALVMQMLAKRPEDRPQEAASLVLALRAAPASAAADRPLARTARLAPPPLTDTSPAEAARAALPPAQIGPTRSSAGRRWGFVLAVIAALIAGAAIAVAIVTSSNSDQSSSTSSPTAAPTSPTISGAGQTSPSGSTSTTPPTTQRTTTRPHTSTARPGPTTATSSTTAAPAPGSGQPSSTSTPGAATHP